MHKLTLDKLLSRPEIRDDDEMLIFVDEYVLRFDVPVGDREHGEVVEASEDLVDVEFGEEGCDFLLFDGLVEIVWEVVHDDVEVLFFTLVREESLPHLQVVWMFQHLQDGVLTVLILLILEHFLDGYLLSSGPVDSEIDNSEGAFASHSLDFIPTGWNLGSLGVYTICGGFYDLICLCFDVLIGGEGFAFAYFELLLRFVAVFEHILRINVNVFGFCDYSLCPFQLSLLLRLLRHLLNFSYHPSVNFFVGIPSLFERQRLVYEHYRL